MHAPTITSPRQAASALREGRLVVLPTETVYGLGALATDPAAVQRVFSTKGRPADHPLIVHVASAEELPRWAQTIPDWVAPLIDRCWPGPLTLVLEASAEVDPLITGGQPTVAVRVPAHPLTLQVLEHLGPGAGIVAPSANVYGQVSPTTADDAWQGLGHRLRPGDLILDGGTCSVGVESTILDCTGPGGAARILRPGAIGAEAISRFAGIEVTGEAQSASDGTTPRVPGSTASHYAPRAAVITVERDQIGSDGVAEFLPAGVHRSDCALIAASDVDTPPGWTRLLAAASDREYAHDLYAALRDGDRRGCQVVVAVLPTGSTELGEAIRDRLHRAAATGSASGSS